tara:strand:+ start:4609 stop:4983 length:375 start_codon:yes stop_codon:yes gene_type:complete
MIDKDYNILGKILSIISDDYPPKMSNKFADKTMEKILHDNVNIHKKTSNSYINVAASIFFAVITTYALVNYDGVDNNPTSIVSEEIENTDTSLIRRVIDKDPCDTNEGSNQKNNESSNDNENCK